MIGAGELSVCLVGMAELKRGPASNMGQSNMCARGSQVDSDPEPVSNRIGTVFGLVIGSASVPRCTFPEIRELLRQMAQA